MGNTILCRNTPCTQPRPVYKTILSQIFQIAWEKSRIDSSSTKNTSMDNAELTNKDTISNVDVPKLQAHVKSNIKGLIDYLEGSHNKLIDTGSYLQKVVTGSFNPDIHMLGLLVIIELLEASPKFSHDKNFLVKLHQRPSNEEFIKAEVDPKVQSNLQSKSKDLDGSSIMEYGQSLRGNIIQFEDYIMEIFMFLLDGKRNPFRKVSYKYVLKALSLYSKNHAGTISADKMEIILNDSLEMIESYQTLSHKEDLEVQNQFLDLLVNLATTNNIVFKFKHKFINHSGNTLKLLYELKQSDNDLRDAESKTLAENMTKLAFDLIATITQSVYDLNEFGILITPLFAFFDNIEWENKQLQTDIFMSLLDSMSNTSFDQAEIFLIDKVVEYIDYNKYTSNVAINPYKHNEDIGVKIRVFSLLEAMFEKTQKTFLSFLVIDNITASFLDNLKFGDITDGEAKELRAAIYNCQKRFIQKINSSSKNLSQTINSISTQLGALIVKELRDDKFIEEILNFLLFTLEEITSYPSHHPIPKESVVIFLKMRSIHDLLLKTFKPIEKLFRIRYRSEDTLTPNEKKGEKKKADLLSCPPDLAYMTLSNNLTIIKSFIEPAKENESPKHINNENFLKFLVHCTKINQSLIMRKDNVILRIQFAFIRKIMDLSIKEGLQKKKKGLLLYFIYNFWKKLNESWNINSMNTNINLIAQSLSSEVIQILEIQKDFKNEDIQKVLEAFEQTDYPQDENQKKEYNTHLDTIATNLKTLHPNGNFDNMNEDFEELNSMYCGNPFVLGDEGEFHKIEQSSVDHHNRSLLTEMTPKVSAHSAAKRNGAKPGSLASFNQIPQNSIMKNSFGGHNEEGNRENSQPSDFVDQSFENAMKEAKKNKMKTNNLSKILNNQI